MHALNNYSDYEFNGSMTLMVALDGNSSFGDNGDMVAALIKDQNEVTLKHFFIKNGTVTLQPANSSMKPIQVDAENVQVQGKVVGVIRTI